MKTKRSIHGAEKILSTFLSPTKSFLHDTPRLNITNVTLWNSFNLRKLFQCSVKRTANQFPMFFASAKGKRITQESELRESGKVKSFVNIQLNSNCKIMALLFHVSNWLSFSLRDFGSSIAENELFTGCLWRMTKLSRVERLSSSTIPPFRGSRRKTFDPGKRKIQKMFREKPQVCLKTFLSARFIIYI